MRFEQFQTYERLSQHRRFFLLECQKVDDLLFGQQPEPNGNISETLAAFALVAEYLFNL